MDNPIDQNTADFAAEYDALVSKYGLALGAAVTLSQDGRIVPILQVVKVDQDKQPIT